MEINRELAALTERIEHMSRQLDDMRPIIPAIAVTQSQLETVNTQLRQLTTNGENRNKIIHTIDKRVLTLERWHKGVMGFTAIAVTLALTLGGYTKSFIETVQDNRSDTNQRLSNLELIVNSKNYEKAFEIQPKQEVLK